MLRKFFTFLAFLSFTNVGCSENSFEKSTTTIFELKEMQKGVCWVGERTKFPDESFPKVLEFGVEWISITPFGWMENHTSPQVKLSTTGYFWGESDEGISATTKEAHKNGIKVMLKPHLWLTKPTNGWIGEINFLTETDWKKWEESYSIFILHYAKLAEQEKIETLAIGTELTNPIKTRPKFWEKLIREIREVYSGKLTYCSNWYQDFSQTDVWKDLDFIGIQAYFPLTEKQNPTIQELLNGWKPHVTEIENTAKKFGKKVIFTEIGYKNTKGTAIKPWEWPEDLSIFQSELDNNAQVNAYEALFRTFGNKNWFGGFYVWKWFPKHNLVETNEVEFSPQNKPAEQTLKKWYTFENEKKND
ncbi:hypothetical protein IT568_12330 [bacterium]|nr:hypothetical protein [bacterium]